LQPPASACRRPSSDEASRNNLRPQNAYIKALAATDFAERLDKLERARVRYWANPRARQAEAAGWGSGRKRAVGREEAKVSCSVLASFDDLIGALLKNPKHFETLHKDTKKLSASFPSARWSMKRCQ
jgi:hypothetical protein